VIAEKRRVLVVDDDGDFRESLSEALEIAGYAATGVANGAEAMATLQSGVHIDLILLDLLMPVMNGWQFCKAKQDEPAFAAIPVIAMSAAVSKDPKSPYYLDVEDHLAKPIEIEQLLTIMRSHAAPSIAGAAATQDR
jgi:CheY-like chemotaxis protein